jgi:ribosome-binding factor A
MPQKSFHRTDRVAAQLRRELGLLVHELVRDVGLPSVSVSDVEITRDMAHAKVFVTALQPERVKEAMAGLKEHARELRFELARAMKLRHVPELHFHYDDSVDRGERIDSLLRSAGVESPHLADADDGSADDRDEF